MIYLYVIQSEVNGNLYVGICKNLTSRLREHNGGKNRYTKGLRPWEIVYSKKISGMVISMENGEILQKRSKEELKRKLAP